ncbi:amidohydrolase family protein [Sabulilitoribacter arenilitoris]|uniref:Amidohydrolase family protein n=1 Tax=Wocania arenilitoris TaxID=2044858 RepID=A0AAE3EPV4_9FLAO|nr:amidohydrolase family protein [Wocania arenilitoris]MCF7569473.1 amidohydrolase family protein [Wocania arenilitoris]
MKKYYLVLLLIISIHCYSQESKLPIIDIHLHAYQEVVPNLKASWAGESYAKELISPENAAIHFQNVLEEMEKNNIKLALTSSSSMKALTIWKQSQPELFLTGIQTNEKGKPILSPDSLKVYFDKNKVNALGELGLQYFGITPNDAMMEPYYQVAEDKGIPVCLHTGLGPPGGPHSFAPKFRTTLGKPTLFEPVLVKHPKLKAFIAHAGWPYISETIAMMYIYPQLYTDIGVLTWALPKKAFYSALKQLIDAGFGKRIMFGTDQMLWPKAVSIAVKTVNDTPFLSDDEKRDILYNNAARFLELSEKTISLHHE